MLYLIGLSIASFLFILLILKRQKTRPDYILQVWLGITILHVGLHYMNHTGLSYKYPHTLGLSLPLPVLHGDLLYFYAVSWTGTKWFSKVRIGLHLIPFLLLTVLAFPFFILPAEQKITIFQRGGEGFEWYSLIQLPAILISGLAYAIATIREIGKGHKNRQDEMNRIQVTSMLRYLAFGLTAIWVLAAVFEDSVIFAGVVIFVLFIGFFGISQMPALFTNLAFDTVSARPVEMKNAGQMAERYVKTGLKEQDAGRIMQEMEEFMKTEKPYKNFTLTLSELAASLEISPNHLSQVINSVSGKTFFNYINHYRVAEFLVLAAQEENKKYTFLALAYDCGFTSKTTFNKYFKLHTGQTPSEYFGKQAVSSAGPEYA